MSLRIAIVGGSVGGLFAGVLLHRAGFDVTILERSTTGLEGRGAGLVAQREVFDLLREVGTEHVARFGVVAQERIYLDRAGGIIHRQQTPQTQLSWDVLWRAFRDRFPTERYVAGKGVESVVPHEAGVMLRLADGSTQDADIAIGADGIGSVLRAAVAGPLSRPSYVGYATWRGLVPEAAMPEPAAGQLFGRFAFYEAAGTQILGYLVPGADGSIEPGRRRYNWVWYRRYSEADIAGVLTDAGGRVHPFSLSPDTVRPEAARQLHADAARLLPPVFAQAVGAEPHPFVHAIFDYAAPRYGVDRLSRDFSGWSPGFLDYDNDGWMDLFSANGDIDYTAHGRGAGGADGRCRLRRPPAYRDGGGQGGRRCRGAARRAGRAGRAEHGACRLRAAALRDGSRGGGVWKAAGRLARLTGAAASRWPKAGQ